MTVAAHFAMLHIDNVVESKTNPRKHFGALDELAASVREKGVLQPVKARPVNGHFELVYGARRFRAAKAVGLKELPALVQEMSDKEALEEQIVENSQREDVPPLEEAEGYKELIEKHGYTPDDLAAKVGKSKRVIYERLQLCKLGKEGRKALDEERLNASVALLVARIPAEMQAKAVADIAARDDDDPGLSYRRAVDHIHRNYMLQLKDAPFSLTDAALVSKAGACAPCPKRTGNQRELFAEVKSADVCTDPKCYRSKEDAVWTLRVAKAKESGQKVIEGAEAKKLFPYGSEHLAHGSEFNKLDDDLWIGDKTKSVKALLGKDAPEPTLARTPDGRIVELVPSDLVRKKIREVQLQSEKLPGRERSSNDSYTKEQKDRERKQRFRRAVVNEAMPKIVAAAEKEGGVRFLRFLADRILQRSFHDGAMSAARRRGLGDEKSRADDMLFRQAMKAAEPELRGIVIEVVTADNASGGSFSSSYSETFTEACKVFGVDVKKLEAAAKEKPKAAKAKGGKAKKAGKKKGAGK